MQRNHLLAAYITCICCWHIAHAFAACIAVVHARLPSRFLSVPDMFAVHAVGIL